MSGSLATDVAFWVFAVAGVASGWRVFRTDSMVRASFLLLVSFVNVGAILLLLTAEYLGLIVLFMMAVEMTVMALFMVMFMMNPAGLNPMNMVHQPRLAAVAGFLLFGSVTAIAVTVDFPDRPVEEPLRVVERLGDEMMSGSMLVFESAGVALLATMVGAIALSARRGRFGPADADSLPPPLEPGGDERPEDTLAAAPSDGDGHHHGGHHHGGGA